MTKILLDLNTPNFQKQLFSLDKIEQRSLLTTLDKISKLTWEQLYNDKGLKWELIISRKTLKGKHMYSFRFSQKYRGVAYRDSDYLVLLNLFTDHDGAYI